MALKEHNTCNDNNYNILKLEKYAKELNILYYDLCDYFNPQDVKSELDSKDLHYNEEGNIIIAQVLKKIILEKFEIVQKVEA